MAVLGSCEVFPLSPLDSVITESLIWEKEHILSLEEIGNEILLWRTDRDIDHRLLELEGVLDILIQAGIFQRPRETELLCDEWKMEGRYPGLLLPGVLTVTPWLQALLSPHTFRPPKSFLPPHRLHSRSGPLLPSPKPSWCLSLH